MGEHLQPDTPSLSPAPDREATERSGSELTRLNSDSYSSITVDRFKDLPSHHCLDLVQTDWTNEKHRSYIDSLEASFVEELHQRRRLRALCSQQNMGRKQIMSDISSSLLMVPQDCSWRKVNFERNDPLLDSTADSHAILKETRMNHFASTGKQFTLETPPDLPEEWVNCSEGRHLRNMSSSCARTRNSQQFHTCRSDPVVTAEVSDQNFVGNYGGELFGSVSIAKRLKKSMADSPSNNQVVPFQRLSSEREKLNAILPSEHPKNFVPPKSDLSYNLRGS